MSRAYKTNKGIYRKINHTPMQFLKYWISAASICIVSAASFCMGRNYEAHYSDSSSIEDLCQKHYEAACLMSDFIRYSINHFTGETECFDIGKELENSYEEFFGDLEMGVFSTTYIRSLKDLDEYSWCY